jgi:hypothetical protein
VLGESSLTSRTRAASVAPPGVVLEEMPVVAKRRPQPAAFVTIQSTSAKAAAFRRASSRPARRSPQWRWSAPQHPCSWGTTTRVAGPRQEDAPSPVDLGKSCDWTHPPAPRRSRADARSEGASRPAAAPPGWPEGVGRRRSIAWTAGSVAGGPFPCTSAGARSADRAASGASSRESRRRSGTRPGGACPGCARPSGRGNLPLDLAARLLDEAPERHAGGARGLARPAAEAPVHVEDEVLGAGRCGPRTPARIR